MHHQLLVLQSGPGIALILRPHPALPLTCLLHSRQAAAKQRRRTSLACHCPMLTLRWDVMQGM